MVVQFVSIKLCFGSTFAGSLREKSKVNIIQLDFTPTKKLSVLGLCLHLMNHSNGMICLAESELFRNKNKVCLPGVVPFDSGKSPDMRKPESHVFIIRGAK